MKNTKLLEILLDATRIYTYKCVHCCMEWAQPNERDPQIAHLCDDCVDELSHRKNIPCKT